MLLQICEIISNRQSLSEFATTVYYLSECALVLPGIDTGIGRLTFFPFFAECKGLIIKLPSLSACCKKKVIKMSKF